MKRSAIVLALSLGVAGCTSGDNGADAGACDRRLPTCPATPPSYQETVGPIINQKCVTCHYPGTTIAKGDFSTYANVYANRGSMLNQAYACIMPPATGGTPLTADERTQLLTWFVCSAPNN